MAKVRTVRVSLFTLGHHLLCDQGHLVMLQLISCKARTDPPSLYHSGEINNVRCTWA